MLTRATKVFKPCSIWETAFQCGQCAWDIGLLTPQPMGMNYRNFAVAPQMSWQALKRVMPVPVVRCQWERQSPRRPEQHDSAEPRSEERRVGKECRSLCDWSSDVCSSDLGKPRFSAANAPGT